MSDNETLPILARARCLSHGYESPDDLQADDDEAHQLELERISQFDRVWPGLS